ncbi:MAG: hypothetical protein FD134_2898 [Gallionellaceae bacterium]|nr:MAG: hypothetical protein FD134_2898 [Gallionellaceae bacterium]
MTRCDAQFKKAVMLKVYDAFEAAGFTRFRKEDVWYDESLLDV